MRQGEQSREEKKREESRPETGETNVRNKPPSITVILILILILLLLIIIIKYPKITTIITIIKIN